MAAQKKRQVKKVTPKKKTIVAKVEQGKEDKSIEIVVSVPKEASVTSVSELPNSPEKTEAEEKVLPLTGDTAEKKESEEESPVDSQTETGETAAPEVSEDALLLEGQNTEEADKGEDEILDKELVDEENGGSKGSLLKKIALWGGVAVVIGVLLGIALKLTYERGILVGEEQMQAKQEAATPTPGATATQTPKNIPVEKYTIKVLNGSGIGGEAARVKGILEQSGYTVSSVGNADASDIEETSIKTKGEVVQSWIDDLKAMLGKSFVVSYSKDLDDSAATDVVVTVGSKKAE